MLLAIPLVTIAIPRTGAETALEMRRAQLSAALEQEWEYQLRAHPEMATYIGDNRFNDRVSDHSAKFFAEDLEHAKQTLRSIDSIEDRKSTRLNSSHIEPSRMPSSA